MISMRCYTSGMERLTNRANGASDQRDERGRFKPGCAPGPGNPLVKRVAEYRNALMECVSIDDYKRVIKRMVEDAINGDAAARSEMLNRLHGRPTQPLEISDAAETQPMAFAAILNDPSLLILANELAKQLSDRGMQRSPAIEHDLVLPSVEEA